MNLSLEETLSSKTKQKKSWVWSLLQTQPLSLEEAPNSKKNTRFTTKGAVTKRFFAHKKKVETLSVKLSLEETPNSLCEFGVSSKLFFFLVCLLSLEISPNSKVEFGEISKLRLFSLFFLSLESFLQTQRLSLVVFFVFSWVWRFLQTQRLSLELFSLFFPEFGVFSKLKGWVWRFLQTQRLSLEISHSEGRCFASNWGWVLKLGLAYRSSLWFHLCLRNDRVSRWVLCGRGGAFAPEYECIHFTFYEIMFL